jgi:uncharacterized membrane-anchored protein
MAFTLSQRNSALFAGIGWLCAFFLMTGSPACADSTEDIWKKIDALPWVHGPQQVSALQNASLQLPQHFLFLDTMGTPEFMRITQNPRDGTEIEQVFGPDDLHWFAILTFSADGYVDDNEKIDADAVLDSIKRGTEQANELRTKNGWAKMFVTGWHRPPAYDPQTNRLEWAIDASEVGGETSTNFNTRILGRRGVTSAVLVTDPTHFESDLVEFKAALAGYDFNPGDRYSEFKSGDKVAEYGLTALILGGAAAVAGKTGILKALGKFLWIGIVAVIAAVSGLFKRIFRFKAKS